MRVKEMHPLCCTSLESAGIGDQLPELATALTCAKSLPVTLIGGSRDEDSSESAAATVAGVLYKWTNYGKGWRSRWFLLKNGVLSYSKIRQPENLNLLALNEDVRLIGAISTSREAGFRGWIVGAAVGGSRRRKPSALFI
ncbi:Oxysterol-binding protein-related protein 2A [Linum perenne]